jgi:hypothetical protein
MGEWARNNECEERPLYHQIVAVECTVIHQSDPSPHPLSSSSYHLSSILPHNLEITPFYF